MSSSRSAATTMLFFLCFLIFSDAVSAASNGMDMSMDGGMTLAAGNMLPYLHFTTGDVLWLQGWVPASPRAMVGACFGLFLLAMFERWLAAMRAVAERQWAKEYNLTKSSASTSRLLYGSRFMATHDIPRGIVHAAQSALELAFMLVAMTFQVSFLISVVVGLGVGEAMFGRYAARARVHVR